MIGHVSIGKSAYHCISYCLEDKRELSEERKEQLSKAEQLNHKDRAEVLHYNQCFGNKKELAAQFRDVQQLSRRCEKPVLHLSLRLAPGETLSKIQLTEIGKACAEEFGVGDHQYICVLHKDTKEQHIHIAANRVGFDGKAAKDGNSYKRMSNLCRRLEKQYGLQEVLSPRAFLSPKDKKIQRHDSRKERMRNDIRKTLEKSESYASFEKEMRSLGYQVIKGRGISFIDDKKVKVKGSELGFSLSKIEKVIELKKQVRKEKEQAQQRQLEQKTPYIQPPKHHYGTHEETEVIEVMERQISKLLNNLTKPEYGADGVNTELIKESRRKKKRRNRQMSR
ncbi:MAG TPA: relaxase/mobilization nuclease domain-containing protein [Pelobium sp.]|nr:relaxase/mobilization nuclease domain-containing protein [Pelobium sp.]